MGKLNNGTLGGLKKRENATRGKVTLPPSPPWEDEEILNIDDDRLDAIAGDYITEGEVAGSLMEAAAADKDWPYVVGLILMEKSYAELFTHPSIQLFIRRVLADHGHPFTHAEAEGMSREEIYGYAKIMIRGYNIAKQEGGNDGAD